MCASDRLPVDRMQQTQPCNTQNEDKNRKRNNRKRDRKYIDRERVEERDTKPPGAARKQCEQTRYVAHIQKGETQAA